MQFISDSSNHEKRKKGRRGLDFLNRMKNSEKLFVSIVSIDYDDKGVDNKLLRYAKENNTKLITTDFNLVKVARLEGVIVLNINEVATVLKPNYFQGDRIKVNIVKKGNSKNQGVGYLEDDTMVIVEEAEKFIGVLKTVAVTSFMQSNSGKIVFARLVSDRIN